LGHPQKRNADAVGRLIIAGMAGAPKKSRQSSKASKPKTEKRPLLPVDEWDFGAVAEIDLPACYLWEYWREKCHRDSSVADALTGLRKDVRADDEAIRQHDQRQLSLFQYLVETKAPGITEAHAESLKIHGEFNLYLWSTVNPLSAQMDGLANISEAYFPCRSFQSLDPVPKQIIRGKTTPRSGKEQRPPLEEIPICHALESQTHVQGVESILFQINWAHTDERIQEAFREWLLIRRGNRKAVLTKGLGPGKSVTKSLLKSLKDLGALRLLTHYGSSAAAYRALDTVNRSVFVDKAEWSKAKKNAESQLQYFKILSD
jgi:hypothetical protein